LIFSETRQLAAKAGMASRDGIIKEPLPCQSMRIAWILYACLTLVSATSDSQRATDIVNMQKSIYSVLGQYDVPEIASRFNPEFKRLDTDGTLIDTLDSLYVMRLLDMQISIQHAKKMRSVLDTLKQVD
jgi:hypothetical protein